MVDSDSLFIPERWRIINIIFYLYLSFIITAISSSFDGYPFVGKRARWLVYVYENVRGWNMKIGLKSHPKYLGLVRAFLNVESKTSIVYTDFTNG